MESKQFRKAIAIVAYQNSLDPGASKGIYSLACRTRQSTEYTLTGLSPHASCRVCTSELQPPSRRIAAVEDVRCFGQVP